MKIRWLASWGCVFLFVFTVICFPNSTKLMARSAPHFAPATCKCGCAGTARPACAHSCGGNPCTGASITYSHIITGDVVENQPSTFSVLAPNGTALTGFVVDFDNGQHVTTDDHGFATFTPIGHTDFNAKISDICSTKIHVLTSDEAAKLPPSVPHFAMAGNQLSISQPGLFSGVASNTHASIGETKCDVLSEAPGQAILKVPAEIPLGSSQLHIEDGGQKFDQPISIIRFSLQADSTTLARNQTTKGKAVIEGASPALVGGMIHISNLSTETVKLQAAGGTDTIEKRIEPGMIKDGRIEIPMTIHATQRGGFIILGGVYDSAARAAKCSCGCGGTPRPACAHSCGGTPCTGK